MPQISASLTINDGSATPVAKSFSPERISPESSTFVERLTSGISAGFKRLLLQFSPASSKRATNRVDINLDLPVLSTVNGVSTVAYVGRFRSYFVIPDVMTAAERADLHAFAKNAMATALVTSMVKDLDPPY